MSLSDGLAALVSIIMPCRNAGAMLRPALASAMVQTYPNLEIIFVDDGSRDGSLAVAQEMASACDSPVTITAAATRGLNAARIHGLAHARGEYVQWLDADDELDRHKIASQVAVLQANPAIDIAYGDWTTRIHRKVESLRERRRYLEPATDQIRRTLSLDWYPPNIFLLRRRAADLLAAEQAWWPGRTAATDIEYFALAALLGLRFVQVPEALVVYNHWSRQQISGSTSYPQQALVLNDIYARLGKLAERADVQCRLQTDHRKLLEQNWDLWALPRGSIEQRTKDGRRVTLRRRSTGKTLDVGPREAAVISLIESNDTARFLAHHASEVMARAPDLFDDQAEVVFLLDRFRHAGLFTQVMPRSSGVAGSSSQERESRKILS